MPVLNRLRRSVCLPLAILAAMAVPMGAQDAPRPSKIGRALRWFAGAPAPLTTPQPPRALPPPAPVDLPTVAPEDLHEAKRALGPVRLSPKDGRHTFHLRTDSKLLCERVLEAYGIATVFDADYQPSPDLRFDLEVVEFAEAVDALQAATGTFLIPVSEKMAMVAKDTQQKRQELEHSIAVAVPLPTTLSTQEAQELARSVQQLMELRKFGIDSSNRVAVARDQVSKVIPAVALFRELLRHRGEVMIEVELIETARNSTLDLGLQWPTRFPLVRLAELLNSPPDIASGLRLLTFGGGKTLLGIGMTDLQMFAAFTKGTSRASQRAEMRAADGQVVNFHIGDKYPILSAGYFGATVGPGETAYTPPPTFNFEDLGVVLKITPHVHTSEEVTLDIEAEYKVLSGQSANGIPVIANRKITSTGRMRMGEAAVVAGLARSNIGRSVTGVAGLASIPVLGYLFRQENRSEEAGEALLVIRPRILSGPPGEMGTREIPTGPEGRLRIPL
ncbi:MAG: type II and III secretion system protein [Bryobacteraceae bacterium]